MSRPNLKVFLYPSLPTSTSHSLIPTISKKHKFPSLLLNPLSIPNPNKSHQ